MPFSLCGVKVGIDREFCTGKATAIEKTCMDSSVSNDEIVRSGKCSYYSEVGLVASWEEKGRRKTEECGEGALQCDVFGVVSGYEAGGSSAEAGSRGGSGSCALQSRVACKSKVVV